MSLKRSRPIPHSNPEATSFASSLKRLRLSILSSAITIPSRTTLISHCLVTLPSSTYEPAIVPTLEILYTCLTQSHTKRYINSMYIYILYTCLTKHVLIPFFTATLSQRFFSSLMRNALFYYSFRNSR